MSGHDNPPKRMPTEPPTDPLKTQVGGDHYKTKGIQPVEYIRANGLDFFEGSALKYLTRHRQKEGKKDLEKAIHYIQMIIAADYSEEKTKEEVPPSAKPGDVHSVAIADPHMSVDRLNSYKTWARDLGLSRLCLEPSIYSYDGQDMFGTLAVVKATVEEIKTRYPAMKLGKHFGAVETVNENEYVFHTSEELHAKYLEGHK